jgi:hypothetical protein
MTISKGNAIAVPERRTEWPRRASLGLAVAKLSGKNSLRTLQLGMTLPEGVEPL